MHSFQIVGQVCFLFLEKKFSMVNTSKTCVCLSVLEDSRFFWSVYLILSLLLLLLLLYINK